jgi:6-pyruvoyltetrahydropterin/6-carboxytetrahydropterin synthase
MRGQDVVLSKPATKCENGFSGDSVVADFENEPIRFPTRLVGICLDRAIAVDVRSVSVFRRVESLRGGLAMPLTILRRIKFCAGHRLHQHGGKCEFFHGHNYTADFYVTADEVDSVGRVIDFADLTRLVKGWLDEHWDPGFVLNQADENGLAAAKMVRPSKYFVLPYNPTAENMAIYLLNEVCPQLLAETGVTATKVVVWETDESFAEAALAAPHVTLPELQDALAMDS